MEKAFADMIEFNKKFGLEIPSELTLLDDDVRRFRVNFLKEELEETIIALETDDVEEIVDGLVDLCYVAIGTALLMGLDFPAHWDEVQKCNMAKERATDPSESKRDSAHDVIKPEGWVGPDHAKIIGDRL